MKKRNNLPVQFFLIYSRAEEIQYQDMYQNFSPNPGTCLVQYSNINGCECVYVCVYVCVCVCVYSSRTAGLVH